MASTTGLTTTTSSSSSTGDSPNSAPLTTSDLTSSISPTTATATTNSNSPPPSPSPISNKVSDNLAILNYYIDNDLIADEKWIDEELSNISNKISLLFDYYMPPTTASKEQIQTGKVKIRGVSYDISSQIQQFIIDLSSLLNLDHVTTYIIIQSYSKNIKQLRYETNEFPKLLEYYYRERFLLLSLVSSLIKKSNDESSEKMKDVVMKYVKENQESWQQKLLKSLLPLASFTIPDHLKDHPQLYTEYTEYVINEQLLVIETLFILYYYKPKISFPKDFKVLLDRYQEIRIGRYSDYLLVQCSDNIRATLLNIEHILVITGMLSIGELPIVPSTNKPRTLSENETTDILNLIKLFERSSLTPSLATIIYSVLLNTMILSPAFIESDQTIIPKCLELNPFQYVRKMIYSNYIVGSASANGYIDIIQLFVNRFTTVYDLLSTDQNAVNIIFDIFTRSLRYNPMSEQDLFNHDLFKYVLSSTIITNQFEKTLKLLTESINNELSSNSMFKILIQTNINEFQQYITTMELNEILRQSFESVDRDGRVITAIGRYQFQLDQQTIYRGAYKCFILEGDNRSCKSVYSIGDRILDIIVDFARDPSMMSPVVFLQVIHLLCRLCQHNKLARHYYWNVLSSNGMTDILIDLIYSFAEERSNQLGREFNGPILQLFSIFMRDRPSELLSFLCEKGCWVRGDSAELITTQYRRGSFLQIYEHEKNFKRSFEATERMVQMFITYISHYQMSRQPTDIELSAFEAMVTFMLQVLSDYWLLQVDDLSNSRGICRSIFECFKLLIVQTHCATPSPYIVRFANRIVNTFCQQGSIVQATLFNAVEQPHQALVSDQMNAQFDLLSREALCLLEAILQHQLEVDQLNSLVNSMLTVRTEEIDAKCLLSVLFDKITSPNKLSYLVINALRSFVHLLIRTNNREFFISSYVSDTQVNSIVDILNQRVDNPLLSAHLINLVGLLKDLSVSQFQLTNRLLPAGSSKFIMTLLKKPVDDVLLDLYPLLSNIHQNSIYFTQFLNELHSESMFWEELIVKSYSTSENNNTITKSISLFNILSVNILSMTIKYNNIPTTSTTCSSSSPYTESDNEFIKAVQKHFKGKLDKNIKQFMILPDLKKRIKLQESIISLVGYSNYPTVGSLIQSRSRTGNQVYDWDYNDRLLVIDNSNRKIELLNTLVDWNEYVQVQRDQIEVMRSMSKFIMVSLLRKKDLIIEAPLTDDRKREVELCRVINILIDTAMIDIDSEDYDGKPQTLANEEWEWLQIVLETLAVVTANFLTNKDNKLTSKTTQTLVPHLTQLIQHYTKYLIINQYNNNNNNNNNSLQSIFTLISTSLISVLKIASQTTLLMYNQLLSPLSLLINSYKNNSNNNNSKFNLSNLAIYTLNILISSVDSDVVIPPTIPTDLLTSLMSRLTSSLNIASDDQTNNSPDIDVANAILELFITFSRQSLLCGQLIVNNVISLLSSINFKYLSLAIDPYMPKSNSDNSIYVKNRWHLIWSKCLTLVLSITHTIPTNSVGDKLPEQLLEFVISHKERFFYYADPAFFLSSESQQHLTSKWFEQIMKLTHLILELSKYTKRFHLGYRVFRDLLCLSHRLALVLTSQLDQHNFIPNHFTAVTLKEKKNNHSKYVRSYSTSTLSPTPDTSLTHSVLVSPKPVNSPEPTKFFLKVERMIFTILRNIIYSMINIHQYINHCESFIAAIPHYSDRATFSTYLFVNQLICMKLNDTKIRPSKDLLDQTVELNCILLDVLSRCYDFRDDLIQLSINFVKNQLEGNPQPIMFSYLSPNSNSSSNYHHYSAPNSPGLNQQSPSLRSKSPSSPPLNLVYQTAATSSNSTNNSNLSGGSQFIL